MLQLGHIWEGEEAFVFTNILSKKFQDILEQKIDIDLKQLSNLLSIGAKIYLSNSYHRFVFVVSGNIISINL